MQILHAITQTESGYTLKVWEPAAITKDRVRPFLWEINLSAATTDEFELVLEQINFLHRYHTKTPGIIPLSSHGLNRIDLDKQLSESLESDECTTSCLCA
jgi:hypothetical protein